eukprot:UN03149
MEAELKRFRHMLYAWKRTRLMKLQKYVFYYVPSNASQSQDTSDKLTKQEKHLE